MDLVFNNNEIDDINEIDSKIDIELKKRGAKKSNTYVKNWNLSKIELKTHLKKLKKTLGCNGSIKKVEGTDDKYIVHLQGDKREIVKEYLIGIGEKESNITVHGYE